MTHARWIGNDLIIGRIKIGSILLDWKRPGPNGEHIAGVCHLPGAASVLGPFADAETAKERVMKSASSRIRGMFGAGIETTANAVIDGRRLRTIARAILSGGVWGCDRRIDAYQLFKDLGVTLGFNPEDMPKRITTVSLDDLSFSDTKIDLKKKEDKWAGDEFDPLEGVS